MRDASYFIGVDVGTGSARAGLFDAEGNLIASASRPIKMWQPEPDYAEQSSEDIWQACAESVRQVIRDSGVPAGLVKGIGFDATCSLVLVDENGQPVTVSKTEAAEQNVVVWMDHRAMEEASVINETGDEVLRYVGGRVSPEMQSPKLLWLKKHLPESWQKAARFFDLPDYLVNRATGEDVRSLCTTVCKWTYSGHRAAEGGSGWSDSFWRRIGLGDLVDEQYARIGQRVRPMGEAVGAGLTHQAAEDFGLEEGTAVAVAIIDAHAGGIGALGTPVGAAEVTSDAFETRLALIGGTSSCHMAVSKEPRFIDGVWGPYYSAMIPGLWLTEGGQSATGALIDHVIFTHARAAEVVNEGKKEGKTVYEVLNGVLDRLGQETDFPAKLTRDLHIFPDFHGNRSPRADPSLRGMISGLRLTNSVEELALLYLAAVQAVAYGTRHIIETLNQSGYAIDTLIATGGGTKNPVFLREHADITGCRIVLPGVTETVLLGSAMLGAVAAGVYPTLPDAMRGMSQAGRVLEPTPGPVAAYHDAKYRVFHQMYEDQLRYRSLMDV